MAILGGTPHTRQPRTASVPLLRAVGRAYLDRGRLHHISLRLCTGLTAGARVHDVSGTREFASFNIDGAESLKFLPRMLLAVLYPAEFV